MDNTQEGTPLELRELPFDIWHRFTLFLGIDEVKQLGQTSAAINANVNNVFETSSRYTWKHEWKDSTETIESVNNLLMRRYVRLVIPIKLRQTSKNNTEKNYVDENYATLRQFFKETDAIRIRESIVNLDLEFKLKFEDENQPYYNTVPVEIIEKISLDRLQLFFGAKQVVRIHIETAAKWPVHNFNLIFATLVIKNIEQFPLLQSVSNTNWDVKIFTQTELARLNSIDRQIQLDLVSRSGTPDFYQIKGLLMSSPRWITWRFDGNIQFEPDVVLENLDTRANGRLRASWFVFSIRPGDFDTGKSFDSKEHANATMLSLLDVLKFLVADVAVVEVISVRQDYHSRYDDYPVDWNEWLDPYENKNVYKKASQMFPRAKFKIKQYSSEFM